MTVSFSIGLDEQAQTRATISDGTSADKLVFAIYKSSNGEIGDDPITTITSASVTVNNATATLTGAGHFEVNTSTVDGGAFSDLKSSVSVTLAKGQEYTVLFWAQDTDCTAYNTDDLKAVTVDYSSYNSGANNDETRDAFYAAKTFTVTQSTSMTVTLKRPFAQVNVGVTEADWNAAKASGIEVSTSSVIFSDVADVIDLSTGKVSQSASPTEIKYTAATIPDSGSMDLTVGDDTYYWLSMSYILVNDGTETGAESTNIDADYTFTTNGKDITVDVTNMPVQRNYRTNILGKILSGDIEFIVRIDKDYDGEENDVWDGKSTTEVTSTTEGTETVYYVSNASELAWIAEQVNEGNSSTATKAGDFFKDATIKLTDDIYLGNQPWTPIGTLPNGENVKQNPSSYGTYAFQGTFDGDGHTIYGLNASSNNATGLFGAVYGKVTIQNVTVDGATVTSNRYAGVIAGYFNAGTGSSLTIENCTVKNSSVTISVEWTTKDDGTLGYDNGDKAGGIIGHAAGYSQAVEITGCSVENTSLTAYRDIGGIVGNIPSSSKNTTITDNTVSDITLTVDATRNYNNISTSSISNFNVGEIVGRNDAGENITLNNNTYENVTKGDMAVSDGVTVNTTTGIYSISSAEGMFWFANEVNVNKNSFSGKTVQLTDDIDLENEVWEPIGQTGSTQFAGTFDGGDHTISNMIINGGYSDTVSDNYASGLFGWIEGKATITRVKVKGADVKGHHYVSCIVGYLNWGTVSYCEVSNATILSSHVDNALGEADGEKLCGDKTGCIVGYVYPGNGSYVSNCSASYSTVTACRDAGQICGYCKDDYIDTESCSATEVTVSVESNSYNNGESKNIGGLVGRTS